MTEILTLNDFTLIITDLDRGGEPEHTTECEELKYNGCKCPIMPFPSCRRITGDYQNSFANMLDWMLKPEYVKAGTELPNVVLAFSYTNQYESQHSAAQKVAFCQVPDEHIEAFIEYMMSDLDICDWAHLIPTYDDPRE